VLDVDVDAEEDIVRHNERISTLIEKNEFVGRLSLFPSKITK